MSVRLGVLRPPDNHWPTHALVSRTRWTGTLLKQERARAQAASLSAQRR
jgi:hypothetical protein